MPSRCCRFGKKVIKEVCERGYGRELGLSPTVLAESFTQPALFKPKATEGARFRCDHGLHLHRCGEAVPAIELNADWSRPTAFAATSVEPEPQNGSSTTSPGRLNVSQMRWIDWLKSQGVQRTVRNRVRWDGEPDNQKPDP